LTDRRATAISVEDLRAIGDKSRRRYFFIGDILRLFTSLWAKFILAIIFQMKEICCKTPHQCRRDSWDIVLTISSLVAILQLLANGRGCASLLTAAIGDCSQGTFMIVLRNDQIPKVNRV
jgi:hypothetical protein